jgi:hypothetical protein
MVVLNYFSKSRGHFKFKYDVIDNKWIDIISIIHSVAMNFDWFQNVYTVIGVNVEALNEFVSNK